MGGVLLESGAATEVNRAGISVHSKPGPRRPTVDQEGHQRTRTDHSSTCLAVGVSCLFRNPVGPPCPPAVTGSRGRRHKGTPFPRNPPLPSSRRRQDYRIKTETTTRQTL